MSLLGYFLLLTAALCCTAAPRPDGSCLKPERLEEAALQGDWDNDSYPPGTVLTYQCRLGYSRLGSIRRSCVNGKWEFLSPKGQCRIKSCGHPGDIPFGSFHLRGGDSFIFGVRVEYYCDDGYQMLSKEKTRECTASGWTNYPPHCEVKNCGSVVVAPNVNVLSTSYDEEYSVGQVVRFECKDANLMLRGPSEIFCTSEGEWNLDPPTCEEISCDHPSINNGKVKDPKRTYKNNEAIQITCNKGFHLSTSRDTKCTKDGWIPTPSCEEIICDAYTPVDKGRLVRKQNVYREDDEIEVECDDGYELQMEPNKPRTCTVNGWNPPIRCVNKRCNRPDIQHGALYNNYDFPRERYIDYWCETNYVPLALYTSWGRSWGRSFCTDLGWKPDPKCLRQCSHGYAYVENAKLRDLKSVYLEGDTITFQCYNDFQTPDGKNKGEIICLPDGGFTRAKCSKTCRTPDLPNGEFKPKENEVDIGKYLQYECYKGYMTKFRNRVKIAQCLTTGWSEELSCKPITCFHNDVTYKHRDVINYTCPSGQKPESELGQCFYYGWGPPVNCQEIIAECTISDPNLVLSPHQDIYQYGSEVSFSCRHGFARHGSLSSKCTEKDWSPPLPTCKREHSTKPDSSEPLPTADTEKGEHSTKPDSSEPLPTADTGKGKGHVQPEATDQQVEASEPESVTPPKDKTDKRKKCPRAYFPNYAEIKDPKREYYSDDNVTIVCKRGYIMYGSPTIRCIEGIWEEPPECISSAKCRNPPMISNGDLTKSSRQGEYFTNDFVTYICSPGFHLTGPEQTTCVNGQWIGEPTCIENSCVPPKEVTYATIVGKKKTYNHGEIAKYECKPGFKLSGDLPQCIRGEWMNTPSCISTICQRPPSVEYSTFPRVKSSYASGETVTYKCNSGYSFEKPGSGVAKCENSEWKNVPVCRRIGANCESPPSVDFGDITSFKKHSYNSGESVEYKCPEYYILEGNAIVKCSNGVWDKAPVCKEPCTANENDMKSNNIALKWKNLKKIYSPHGDHVEFACIPNHEALPGTELRVACNEGKMEYPTCFKKGFCKLDEQTMINQNIQYNGSTIVNNGQIITFQCIEGMTSEDSLEARCEDKTINYPKCVAAKSCKVPEILNGVLKTEHQASYESGSFVEFECNEGYAINGPINVKCDNGQWTQLPECNSPCKIFKEDLTDRHIQLLNDSEHILDSTHRHGTLLTATCKQGFIRPNQPTFTIECSNGKFKYIRCLSGKICRINQDKVDENNLELDDSHDNEVFYEQGETVRFKCKTGYRSRGNLNGRCSERELSYPTCTVRSTG